MAGNRSGRNAGRRIGLVDREGFWEGLVALAALALFARTVGFGWVYDDQMEIVLNPFIRSLSNLPTIFSTTVWAGSGMETYLYRPLALVTYSLNHVVSGLAPWSYHLVNILLHAGASILVLRVGRMWGLSMVAAGVGGLLFALHPIHVEVVAAVFGRKDLLAGFFTLAMVLLHGPAAKRGGWRTVLPVAAYGCAMLSKEVGVVGIALVAVQDWILTADRSSLARDGRRARLYVGYLAILLGYVLVRNAVTGGVGVPDTFYMDNPLVAAPFGVRLATALVVVGKGLALLAFPNDLSPDYSFDAIPLVHSPLDGRLLGTLALGAVVAWGLWRRRPSRANEGRGPEGENPDHPAGDSGASTPFIFLALSWYAITLLPTANILVTVGTIFGERLLYLPSVAFCLVAGACVGKLMPEARSPGVARGGSTPRTAPQKGTNRQGANTKEEAWGSQESGMGLRVLGWAGATLWIGALAIQALVYSGAWDNDIDLFRRAVAHVPSSTKANHKLGEELLRAGEIGAALPFLRRALEIAPDNVFAAQTLADAKHRIGSMYLPEEPGSAPLFQPPPDPEILYALGQMSREGGNLPGAAAYWEAALALDSTHSQSHGDLGALELMAGDTTSAVAHLQAAVRQEPGMARAWFALGRVFFAQGKTEDAGRALGAFLETAGTRFPDQVSWAREALSRISRD